MSEQTLSDSDNGKLIDVNLTTRISLILPENPSTGYIWSLDLPDGIQIESSTFLAASKQMPGAGGEHTWVLRPLHSGDLVVHAKLWREWEGDQSVLQRFQVTLRVPTDRR